MNIHHVLFFCFLSVLHAGNTGLAQSTITTKTEGEDFRDSFKVDRDESSGLYLYKNNSGKEELLIETFRKRAQSGRYIVRYDGELFVTITELALSDTGQYRFGVSNSSLQSSYKTFELRIKERCGGSVIFGKPSFYSIPEGGNVTIRCSLTASEQNKKFLCREECKKVLIETTDVVAKSDRYSIEYGSKIFFNVTITQLTESDSGRYRCGVGRLTEQNTCQEFKISITNSSEGYTVTVVVSLIVIVLLAAFLLLLYQWKMGITCNYLKSRRPSSSRNTEFVPHDNGAQSSTLEDNTYDNVTPSSTYQILNQPNHDEMYSTLGQ